MRDDRLDVMLDSMEQKVSRPANRPSRRPEIVRAAIYLLALQSPDSISVADIATQAGMTPAAFYYHFPSKDDLLDEIVASFATTWAAEITARLDMLRDPEDVPELVSDVIAWLDEHERVGTVYFVTLVAATEQSEETRRRVRNELFDTSIRAVRRVWPSASPAEASMTGVALVILLEVSARSRLQLDESYRGLGPVRFRLAAASLARGLVASAS
jgi:AcrR family transcriptional regulator